VGLVQKCPQEKRPSQLTPQRKKNVTNQYRNNNQCIKCNHLVEMAYFLGSCSEGILDQPIYTQTEYSNTFCLALPSEYNSNPYSLGEARLSFVFSYDDYFLFSYSSNSSATRQRTNCQKIGLLYTTTAVRYFAQ